jgi:hypothetical protein
MGLLRDGLLEFEPHTEKLYITALGSLHLYEKLRDPLK